LRVVLVDDHLLFLEVLASALTRAGLDVVGRAGRGDRAIEVVTELSPDLVLLDLTLPDRSGKDVGVQILSSMPHVRVVALSGIEDPALSVELRGAGFHGYLSKKSRIDQLVAELAGVEQGGAWPMMSTATRPRRVPAGPALDHLTDREWEVLQLLTEGLSGKAIAERLGVATNTARSHIQNILVKLQVHSRLEAVVIATGRRPDVWTDARPKHADGLVNLSTVGGSSVVGG
jgi:two-component system, NarL family, nitrate/nitrite response regulator NarL